MEIDFEIQHRLGRNDTAADALSRLSTNRTDYVENAEDLLAYAVAGYYEKLDKCNKNGQNLLLAQKFVAAQEEEARYWHLVKKADSRNIPFI